MTAVEPWTFGVEPLPQSQQVAGALRRVADLLLALENEDDAVDQLLADLERAERALRKNVPANPVPRVGPAVDGDDDGDGRVYVDHARDVGAYNPVFPTYEITVSGDLAEGTVNFPLVFEGPPGLVHGGFLAVFFDLVVQHHNCDVGVAGKTTSLRLGFRRPAPLLTDLRFSVHRRVAGDRIRSTAELRLGEERGSKLVCEAEIDAIAGVRENLPAVSPRRTSKRPASDASVSDGPAQGQASGGAG